VIYHYDKVFHAYKSWRNAWQVTTDLTQEEIEAVEGVDWAVKGRGNKFCVEVDRRFNTDEVMKELMRRAVRKEARETGNKCESPKLNVYVDGRVHYFVESVVVTDGYGRERYSFGHHSPGRECQLELCKRNKPGDLIHFCINAVNLRRLHDSLQGTRRSIEAYRAWYSRRRHLDDAVRRIDIALDILAEVEG
jgi:hypothetical protein